MSFSWHLRERAARQLVKESRCCRGWVAWVVTMLLILSALAIPVQAGTRFHPLAFGILCAFFLVPAVWRAKSLLEPIWHPATVVLPKNASLLGLHPDPKPVKCFYIASKLPIIVLVILTRLAFMLNMLDNSYTVPDVFHDQSAQCCESQVSILFGSTQSECDFTNFTSWYSQECDTTTGSQVLDATCHFQDQDSQSRNSLSLCDWMDACSWQALGWLEFLILETRHHMDSQGCWQLMTVGECMEAFETLPADMMALLKCHNYSAIAEEFCNGFVELPPAQRCYPDDQEVHNFMSCSRTSVSRWLISCDAELRSYSLVNSENMDGFTQMLYALEAMPQVIGVFCPLLAFVLLLAALCCFPLPTGETAFRLAVCAKVEELQAEIDTKQKADIGRLGPWLFRVDLVLVFVDFLGDIFAIYTWIATSHSWFAVFQALIILRSSVDIVRLQRREGLISEVKKSLQADTLTNGLYKLMLQEKTVEGTQTSILLAYGLFYTFDSPFVLIWTLFKWLMSLRSMTNGCFIQFHLVPGDVLDTPLLNGLILGRTVQDRE